MSVIQHFEITLSKIKKNRTSRNCSKTVNLGSVFFLDTRYLVCYFDCYFRTNVSSKLSKHDKMTECSFNALAFLFKVRIWSRAQRTVPRSFHGVQSVIRRVSRGRYRVSWREALTNAICDACVQFVVSTCIQGCAMHRVYSSFWSTRIWRRWWNTGFYYNPGIRPTCLPKQLSCVCFKVLW